MHKILGDTCVWLDLAKEPQQRPLLNVLFELESAKEIALIVPSTVLVEFQRHKDRVAQHNTQNIRDTLKRVKELVGKYGDGSAQQAALDQINLVGNKLPRLGDAVTNAVDNIERLLLRGEVVETTDAVMLRAAQRALERKAPFIKERNLADAVIIESFADCAHGPASAGHRFAFVTHNKNDFSDPTGNQKNPHPEIAPIFTGRKVRYFISLAEALNWASPGSVEEFAFDFENQPRRTDEILEAVDLLWHQVWYNRHKGHRLRIERGEVSVTPEVWRTMLEAAKRVESKYGKRNLGPWDDFEWGMINGKLSALNWVLGEEWDFLDT
jgi:hypothetical protein